MSVYIKGFEFPTTCCHCKLMVYNPELVWDDAGESITGGWVCLLTGEIIDNTKREDHCPLVPVPPHGELCDKTALIDKIGENIDKAKDRSYDWWYACTVAYDFTLAAPTIIPGDTAEGEN